MRESLKSTSKYYDPVIVMEDMVPEGKIFEVEDNSFDCLICEETIEFEFDPDGPMETDPEEELIGEFEEDIATPDNFTEEVEPEIDGNEEESMMIDCECGAEYLIKKVPGVPGFEVVHLVEEEPELIEKEFENEFH